LLGKESSDGKKKEKDENEEGTFISAREKKEQGHLKNAHKLRREHCSAGGKKKRDRIKLKGF